jgi:hypothetical protein
MSPSNHLDDKKTSEVQWSGRNIFQFVKIFVDVIDDELTISDATECAGKKVDLIKRIMRIGAGAGRGLSKMEATGAIRKSSHDNKSVLKLSVST